MNFFVYCAKHVTYTVVYKSRSIVNVLRVMKNLKVAVRGDAVWQSSVFHWKKIRLLMFLFRTKKGVGYGQNPFTCKAL